MPPKKKTTTKPKMGRPPKISEKIKNNIALLSLRGFIDTEIADIIGVTRATIHNWNKKYPDLFDTRKANKDIADKKVQAALYDRAVGFEYDEVTTEISDTFGRKSKTVKKKVLPDTTACIFWLKNRKKKEWRDVQQREVTGEITLVTESLAKAKARVKKVQK